MTQPNQQNLPKDKFLMLAVNLLHRHFIAPGRTEAKRLYREIQEGRTAALTTVRMEDQSTLSFKLVLDHSEFPGRLNFSAFRAGLSTLMGNIARTVQAEKEVTVFNMTDRPDSVLFGITGVVVEDGQPSVMALGADTGGQVGAVTLQLMYLDPKQFASSASAAGGTA